MILPFAIVRRLDCILAPTKERVIGEYKKAQSQKIDPALVVKSKFKLPFFNTSHWIFAMGAEAAEAVPLVNDP